MHLGARIKHSVERRRDQVDADDLEERKGRARRFNRDRVLTLVSGIAADPAVHVPQALPQCAPTLRGRGAEHIRQLTSSVAPELLLQPAINVEDALKLFVSTCPTIILNITYTKSSRTVL